VSRTIRQYETEHIRVSFDVARCIHAAQCVARLGKVFDPSKRPWVQPEHASPADISETVSHCPTGALHFERLDGGQPEWPDAVNTVTVEPNGPLYVRGQIQILAADGTMLLEDTRVAFCRCGASKAKPLCDGSHTEAGFRDPAILGRRPVPAEAPEHAPLTVTVRPNGPLRLEGPHRIVARTAQPALSLERCSLCRCGHSAVRPFCDGAHKKVGFLAE